METRRFIPWLVGGTGFIGLAAAGLIQLATGGEDYADLVPAPDAIIWEEEQESTVLVSTNLDDVDLRIDSVALGIEAVRGAVPHSGELMVLGASVGCQEWAVSRLTADTINTSGFSITGNIDRDNFVDTAQVHYRFRVQGEREWTTGLSSPVDVPYVSGDPDASNAFDFYDLYGDEIWEVEASSDDNFPVALTRFITVDSSEGTATTDEEAESIVLLKDTGVVLKACSEHDDVMLTLHDADGEELNRYIVDIGPPPPTPVPTAVPTATPNPYAGSVSRRICVDGVVGRYEYLDGGELVGAAFDHDDFGLVNDIEEARIGESEDGAVNRYFFGQTLTAGSLQLTVSATGAADTQGLTNDRVYPVRLTAKDDTGQEKWLDVAVWLDTTNQSPGDDGLCS